MTLQVRQARESEATAEWIVDITTWADRQGRATEFADAYSQSQLKQQNNQQLQKFLTNEDSQVKLLYTMLASERGAAAAGDRVCQCESLS